MSLDVYLTGETREVECICAQCDNKHMRKETEQLFEANITHNLNAMARAAGIYEHLWRPDEINITKAGQLIEPLRRGLTQMEADPDKFKPFNATNGWGTYEQFMPWIKRYLRACEEHPEANVNVSR